LPGAQINDLRAGLWYVNVSSGDPSFNGPIRGQITPVPEPSSLVLIGLGAGYLAVFSRWKPL